MNINRFKEVASPQRKYHERKKFASLALRLLDIFLLLLPQRLGHSSSNGQPPRRILLMNPAHIGDVLLSTSVLPELRRAYPDAEIGFLVGSWSKQVVQGHPEITYIHTLDMARLNRGETPKWKKLKQQRSTRLVAEREIRMLRYDLAIDLSTGFPPMSWLAWECYIPRRVGYLSRGFGALLTEPINFDELPNKHETKYHLDLVRVASGITSNPHSFIYPSLFYPNEYACMSAAAALGWNTLDDKPYIVIHPGSGERRREWSLVKWKILIARLVMDGNTVVLVGRGNHEAELCNELSMEEPALINLCDKLDWKALSALFAKASLLIGLESMSGHLASAWQVPTVSLYTGMADPDRWRPANQNGIVLHTTPPCFPCMNRKGCETMACIRGIEPEVVFESAIKLLKVER